MRHRLLCTDYSYMILLLCGICKLHSSEKITPKALSSLRGLRGAPEVPPLCRERSVCRTANVGTVGMNGLSGVVVPRGISLLDSCTHDLCRICRHALNKAHHSDIVVVKASFARRLIIGETSTYYRVRFLVLLVFRKSIQVNRVVFSHACKL